MPRHMALSNQDAKLLIKEVEKRACLWDPEDDRYNDRYHMARAWSEISELIHMPEDRLRVKWKNMRDLFKKELKKYGSSVEYMGKWRHFMDLIFLNKTATGNVSENNEESCEDAETVTKQEYIELEAEPDTENGVEVYYEDTDEDPLPEKRPRRTSEDRVRVKWKTMRDHFKKEIKKYGSSEKYMGKWRHFKDMTFLNKTDTVNISETKSENNEESCEDTEFVTKQEYIKIDAEPYTENGIDAYFDNTYEDPLPEKRFKRSSDDEYDLMFLKSLAPYFKQLDPLRKLVVRSKMQDMLLNEIAAQTSSNQFQFSKSKN